MDKDATRMATGYFWSILAMMNAPFLVVSFLTFMIVRAVKKARATES